METIILNNKEYRIVEGEPNLCTPINSALIDIQNKRQSSGRAAAYYAQNFYNYLRERNIFDLSNVTAAEVRFFAESLADENKSSSVILSYAQVLDEIFDSFCELNGRPHVTLLQGDAEYAVCGRGKPRFKHHTRAGNIVMRRLSRKDKNVNPLMVSYSKWLTPEEINCVYQTLSLRDRCIFLCSVETGYRISSVLSIKTDIDLIRTGYVEETFSKTGHLHQAPITKVLQEDLSEYISGERCRTVKNAGDDCGYLFVHSKGKHVGQQLTYDAYYHALKAAEARIHASNEDMQHLVLHSHAGRSTYFNRLMHTNQENKQAGETYLSDATICQLMDWASMACLQAYYDFYERAIPPSLLYRELTPH